MTKNKKEDKSFTAAQNRRARFEYEILEEVEAGICLSGTEVKGLRSGKANIADSYAEPRGGEIFLVNAYIPEYGKAAMFNHKPRRDRKLLMHKREISKFGGRVLTKGLTLIPLSIYFNNRGFAKVKLALGKGKTKYDKRDTEKKRDWEREKSRIMREN